MASSKILLVDDDETLRDGLATILEEHEFIVSIAGDVRTALKKISDETFDVLLSDLHMPGAGDGLTVVSAMRHSNPASITLLLSAFPEMVAATEAILLQADEILLKPMNAPALIEIIKQRLASGPRKGRTVESVATILERTTESTIQHWLERVELDEKLMAVPMSVELRCDHLPTVFLDLIRRLLSFKPLGTKELKSVAAIDHGILRRKQGYSAAMLVEESRLLQVSIFETLQENLANIDFSLVLLNVMTIADEIDSQLSQAMDSYITESITDALPA